MMWLFADASAWAVGYTNDDQQLSEKLVAQRVHETRVAEFGNQRMRKNTKLKFKTHGEYIRSMGFQYECFDINGKDGSHKVDLRNVWEGVRWENCFDIVTNYGTLEHIEGEQVIPLENMHRMCKPCGTMIHALPMVGGWPKHCPWLYGSLYLEQLAKEMGYAIRDQRIVHRDDGDMLCAWMVQPLQKEVMAINQEDLDVYRNPTF